MTVDSIIKLLDAGYTKDEITAMDVVKDEPAKDEPVKEEPKKEDLKKEEPVKNDDMLKLIVEKFDEMKNTIIESNIVNSNNKQLETPEPAELLANVVKPNKK